MRRATVILLLGCGRAESGNADASPLDMATATATATATPTATATAVTTATATAATTATTTPTATATASAAPARCPHGMTAVGDAFCIDTYEAHVVLVDAAGHERPHSPYQIVDAPNVRAKVAPDVVPQAFISQVAAKRACRNANKRLCRRDEFERACRGDDDTNLYPYGGAERVRGTCNEGKGSSVPRFFGADAAKWKYADFNDPRLNQWIGGLAKTGAFPRCASPYGVYDLVGNLHEWGDDDADERGRGRFRGGFYGDAEVNGHGCLYVTKAHELTYHDYSTGFRCCADVDR